MFARPACLLPDAVVPEHYDLSFRPNPQIFTATEPEESDFTFEGHAVIAINILQPVSAITLNAADLSISQAWVTPAENLGTGQEKDRAQSVTLGSTAETATFDFGKELLPGKYGLTITFSGIHNDQMCGWYRSRYKLSSGEERWMLASQSESTDARRIFPCWDEPEHKATFEVSVVVPKNRVAISNMHVFCSRETDDHHSLEIRFAKTPRMSTYLFTLLVGEFESLEGEAFAGPEGRSVAMGICTTPGKKEQGSFALKRAIRTLEFDAHYYDFPYPLLKLDHVAIPDFAAGAMENLGAITYREPALLFDQKSSSETGKDRVCEVVDHETSHMWNGDIVTMKWWHGLWLNEACASFMELVTARALNPEFAPDDAFVAGDYANGLENDGLQNSHPIHMPINHPSEIDEAFDMIAYCKGASVLRMLENYLGADVYRDGMRLFIRRHAYGNADIKDFLQALEDASGQPVTDIMREWLLETGYPLVFVQRFKTEQGSFLSVQQKRFFYDPPENTADTTWKIPISVRTESGQVTKIFLDKPLVSIPAAELDLSGWMKVNPGHFGFFRTFYPEGDLLKFHQAILDQTLPVSDRIGLLDDVFALAKAGYYNLKVLLKFLSAYKNETDRQVWETILRILAELHLMTKGRYEKLLQNFIVELTRNTVDRLGWHQNPEDSHHTKALRGLVLQASGIAGREDVIAEATDRFLRHLTSEEIINPNLRNAVYGIVAAHGGAFEHRELQKLYRFSGLQEEQLRILAAMAEFRNPTLIEETLHFYVSKEVRSGEVYVLMRSIALNPNARDLGWKFVKENWGIFYKMYKESKLLGRLIESVCDKLGSEGDEENVRSFFEAHPVLEAKRTIAQALEKIRINTDWRGREEQHLRTWSSGFWNPFQI